MFNKSSNILLNDTGRRQCKKLRDKLKDKSFDVCYMSPLVRCVETAFILVGDKVEIMETRPLSATKHFRLVKVVEEVKA